MVAPANSRFKTVADVAAFAKANPRKLSCASFGLGSGPYMVSELFDACQAAIASSIGHALDVKGVRSE